MNLIKCFLEDSNQDLKDYVTMLGLGRRLKNQITENKDLRTVIETLFLKKEFSSLELIFNENCKDGDINMVHRVIMRNFMPFLKTPQMDFLMRPLFIDDNENQNQVKFAMILPEKELPVYQKGQHITGFNVDYNSILYPEKPDFKI